MDRFNAYLSKYINKELAPFLGFHHWIFHISEEQVDEVDWCEISVEDYDEATIKVGSRFKNASAQMKVQALIHELMHIPVIRIFEHVEESIEYTDDWDMHKFMNKGLYLCISQSSVYSNMWRNPLNP